MTVTAAHRYALRGPWYEQEREFLRTGSAGAAAGRPVLQKYATQEFVQILLADPRDSLAFDPAEDVWSYPIPLGATPGTTPRPGEGRLGFSTHRLVRTPLRKLYQPNHDRFYAVVIELFCDEPGLPLPGRVSGVDVGFVIRREVTVLPPDARQRHATEIRALARKVLLQSDPGRAPGPPKKGDDADIEDVLMTSSDVRRAHEAEWEALLARLGARQAVEGWVQQPGQPGKWAELPDDPAGPYLLPHEQEQPMWRIPLRDGDCAKAAERGLWFGLVPTYSGEVDVNGVRKLDEHALYTLRCFARARPRPGYEGCPPVIWWSDPSQQYRLASFFDPDGTKNHKTSVTAPDLRALAARAGAPPGPGGLEVVRPPGSQLMFDPNGGTPQDADPPGGTSSETCTYAIQLLMIVAMFVFSLFLPIIVFLFQLWWLLLLRFCWPPSTSALATLRAFFEGRDGGDPTKMNQSQREALADVFGAKGIAKQLDTARDKVTNNLVFHGKPGLMRDYVQAVAPEDDITPAVPGPEAKPDDPLCPAPN